MQPYLETLQPVGYFLYTFDKYINHLNVWFYQNYRQQIDQDQSENDGSVATTIFWDPGAMWSLPLSAKNFLDGFN